MHADCGAKQVRGANAQWLQRQESKLPKVTTDRCWSAHSAQSDSDESPRECALEPNLPARTPSNPPRPLASRRVDPRHVPLDSGRFLDPVPLASGSASPILLMGKGAGGEWLVMAVLLLVVMFDVFLSKERHF